MKHFVAGVDVAGDTFLEDIGSFTENTLRDGVSWPTLAIGVSVAGLLLFFTPRYPKIPVPLIVFHGKKDDAIAYDHSVTLGAGREKTVPVPDAIAYWVNLNRAFPAPAQKTLFDGAALVDFYRALPGGAPVVLYTLPEGTHQWPHDPKGELSATRIMWGFFKQFSRESPP